MKFMFFFFSPPLFSLFLSLPLSLSHPPSFFLCLSPILMHTYIRTYPKMNHSLCMDG